MTIQAFDDNARPISNVFVPIGAPIVLASGSTSNAFLDTAIVELNGRTAECFYIVGETATATTSHTPLPVGATKQIQIPVGYKIGSTGGELRVTILGTIGNTVAEFYV
tara:strand:+ start:1972 stop:2295 length:324 start_codon:yes stop_codon:yes gene_type:complete